MVDQVGIALAQCRDRRVFGVARAAFEPLQDQHPVALVLGDPAADGLQPLAQGAGGFALALTGVNLHALETAGALVGPVVDPVEFDLDSPLVLVLMAPAPVDPVAPVAPVVPVVLVAPVPLPLVEVLALALLAVALPLAVALLVEHPVVLAVPAVPAAEALVVEVRQVRSESKAESRARRARARRCAAKSSTICKLPSSVASSSLVVMDQPRFACHVALRSLTLLIASMQTQRCSLPRSFTSVKWSTQRSR